MLLQTHGKDGLGADDTPTTLVQRSSQGLPRPLIQKKTEKGNEKGIDFDLISYLRSKLVPTLAKDLLVERMTGYCDGVHIKEKLNALIDAHNKLVNLYLTSDTDVNRYRGHQFEHVIVDEHSTVGNPVVVAIPSTIELNEKPICNCELCSIGKSVKPMPPPGMTELEILNLAHILKLWGWYCRCVVPVGQKKGPITICKECNRIVVNEEND